MYLYCIAIFITMVYDVIVKHMALEPGASRLWLINFYREQLSKFRRLGMGQETEFGVVITKKMIQITENRLNDLTLVWRAGASEQAEYQRRMRAKMKGHTNGSSNTTGTTVKPGK